MKLTGKNFYANSLLIGNITGKYNFYDFYLDSVKGLNLDAFTKDNEDLIQDLKSHFVEYVVSNNKHKNIFAEKIQAGITNEIEQIRKKEGLKVVIYDKYKIKESMQKDRQLQDKEEKDKDEEDRERSL